MTKPSADNQSGQPLGLPLNDGLGAWQPIDKAPYGVMMLFADMKASEARWWAFCGWRHSGLQGAYVQMPDNTARTATHWQHLPQPPHRYTNPAQCNSERPHERRPDMACSNIQCGLLGECVLSYRRSPLTPNAELTGNRRRAAP